MSWSRFARVPALFLLAILVAAPATARGDESPAPVPPVPPTAAPVPAPPANDLASVLGRVARHAAQFEEMKKRGSFTLSGRMEELDSSGKVDSTKEMVVRMTATPSGRFSEIVKYLEDGADKTAEAQEKGRKRRAEQSKSTKKKQDIHLPFLASEQARYVFSFAERDPNDSNRVRIAFRPHAAAEDAFKGSAWIDEAKGEVLTLGFSPTKNPTFVDHVDVTMRFDLTTPLGRAPSSFTFDARGGFLIIKKHYRGSATISDPRIAF